MPPITGTLPSDWNLILKGIALLTFALFFSQPTLEVHAQGQGKQAAADSLFEKAIQLRDQGKHKKACKFFQRSLDIDPARGTLYNLGMCKEKQGKVASALGTFQLLLDQAEAAGDKERVLAARKYLKSLRSRVPTLEINVPQGKLPEGFNISIAGVELEEALWGVAAPTDPGKILVKVAAPGFKSYQTQIVVVEGSSKKLNLESLQRLELESDLDTSDTQNHPIHPDALRVWFGALSFREESLHAFSPQVSLQYKRSFDNQSSGIFLGMRADFARIQPDSAATHKSTQTISALAQVGYNLAFSDTWKLEFSLAAGALVLQGLESDSHPWVDPTVAATGPILLGKAAFETAIQARVSESLQLLFSPIQLGYSPSRNGLAKELSSLVSIGFQAGVAWSF